VIRGIGVYVDGAPKRTAGDRIVPGGLFGEDDVPALEKMWADALEGGTDSFVWLGLRDCGPDEVETAARVFGIDDLQIEDALSIGQRAHVEVRAELEGDSHLLSMGPLAVLHGNLDVFVDGYQLVADELARDIEQIEERVFSPERTDDAAIIYKLKRENLEVRRAVDPLRPVGAQLLDHELVAMPEGLRPYFHDLGDHLLRVAELSAQHDVLLGTVLEASRSRQAVMQNDDMRKISAWVAIAAVPTMIAGIYGMNFDFMPELHERWGYPAVLTLMVTACGLMYRAFKRSGWL